jgi:transcriptional regulator with XRE-family HTH domain
VSAAKSSQELPGDAKSEMAAETLVGRRLRALRLQRRLSLRALAGRSGLNINTLSLIENGKTSPSVSTLQQLARGLGVPIAALFEAEMEPKRVIYTPSKRRPQAHFNAARMEALGQGLAGNAVQPFVVTLEVGAGSGSRPIVHTGYEFVYCLAGQVLYRVDEQAYLLQPGDSRLFEAHLPHRWQNTAAEPSQVLLVLHASDEREEPGGRHFHF